MTSWRDSVSEHAQNDLDALLNDALPFAQESLDQRGEFFPYAVVLETTGGVRMVAGDPGLGERPSSQEVLTVLVAGLREGRENLRAVGVVSDVRLSKSDAIRVELEHEEGAAMTVVLPYTKKRFRRGVEYGELSAAAGAPAVWQ